jgi:hypothetical protein
MSNQGLQQSVQKSFSAVQYCEGGQFRPTLVVGLGGSGVETARRVKRILHERYQVDNLIRFCSLTPTKHNTFRTASWQRRSSTSALQSRCATRNSSLTN